MNSRSVSAPKQAAMAGFRIMVLAVLVLGPAAVLAQDAPSEAGRSTVELPRLVAQLGHSDTMQSVAKQIKRQLQLKQFGFY